VVRRSAPRSDLLDLGCGVGEGEWIIKY
jgi:hypothetical protein